MRGIYAMIFILILLPGCKKKNDVIEQGFEKPVRVYKHAKKQIKDINKKHIEQLQQLNDSINN